MVTGDYDVRLCIGRVIVYLIDLLCLFSHFLSFLSFAVTGSWPFPFFSFLFLRTGDGHVLLRGQGRA